MKLLIYFYLACASLPDLLPLPGTVACHLSSSCTALDCCVSSSKLGQSFRAYLDVDPCTSRITVGIDDWTFTELSEETIKMLNTGELNSYLFLCKTQDGT